MKKRIITTASGLAATGQAKATTATGSAVVSVGGALTPFIGTTTMVLFVAVVPSILYAVLTVSAAGKTKWRLAAELALNFFLALLLALFASPIVAEIGVTLLNRQLGTSIEYNDNARMLVSGIMAVFGTPLLFKIFRKWGIV